jgi:membrane protease YdiL (CAAX protease family)
MAILFVIFLFLLPAWGKRIYHNPSIFKSLGLANSKRNSLYLGKGLLIGFVFTWLLFAVEYLFGWISFQSPSIAVTKLVIEGFISALGIAFAEELFFRGWLLYEIERDFSLSASSMINSIIFASLHFIKPLREIIRTSVTFPALVLLGYILVVAKRSHKNLLGISIGLHGGLVWGYYLINVGQIVKYTDKVPPWITGIDNNPIAGIMGLIFLSLLLYLMKSVSLAIIKLD